MAVVAGLVAARPVAAADTPVASTSLAIRNRPDPGDPSGRKIKTCTSPRPRTPYGFAPRPEGGPIFYFQDGSLLYTAAFSGPTFSIQSSVPALGDGTQLLPAFDGKLLLQVLGIGDDALATYTVASDLVTVTPNTHAPIDPRPTSGVLMPCPAS